MPNPNETWLINQRTKVASSARDQVARDRAQIRFRVTELVSPIAPPTVSAPPAPGTPEEEPI